MISRATSPTSADEEQDAEGERRSMPSDSALANRPSIRFVVQRPKRERDEARRARPERAAEAEARAREEARLLRRLDLALGFVDRRRRGRGRDRLVLRADDCGRRRSGAGASSTAMRRSSSRKARGRGGRSLMRVGPRSGIAARGRAGYAARAAPGAVSGGRKRTKRQSLSASGRRDRVALEDRLRVGRQFAGKDGRFGDAVEHLAADRLALLRHADDRRRASRRRA